MTTGARLSFESVTFGYPGLPVLADLSLELAAGGMVALLGRNGAGKSTLLGLATGVLAPGRGAVRLDGVSLAELPLRDRARRTAMVPQTLPAPPAFSVRELVSLGRTPYLTAWRGERTADREAVEWAMEQANVAGLASRLVGEISGGERQRVALALALAQEPDLLLLDEPTSHLDIHHQMALLGLVRKLNREAGITVLAAVHDLNLAALWFDRLVLLDAGRVAADGPPEAVLRREVLEPVYESRLQVLRHPTEEVPLVALERPARGEE